MNQQGVLLGVTRAGALMLLAVATLAAAGPARASECSDMAYPPICSDAQTLTWCEDGGLKTVVCPEGEVCAADQMFYGGVGCVSVEETDCGDITAEGQCTSANSVVWCDTTRGEVVIYECGDYLQCDHDAESQQYDCLPPNVMTAGTDAPDELPEPPGEHGAAPDDGPDDAPPPNDEVPAGDDVPAGAGPGTMGDEEPRGPTPEVSPSANGGEGASLEAADAGAGCQASRGSEPWPLALLVAGLGMLTVATRRRSMRAAVVSD